jgi:SulP family sulfate permease
MSFRAAARESALARARLDHLKTNRTRKKGPPSRSGLDEIRTTLRDRWSEILSGGLSYHDVLAGLTVAAVAIPLNVALAIAAGLPPSAGLLAGAVGGVFAAAFGGSSYQVSGPAAAMNLMVFGIVAKFGVAGAAAAALVCGVVALALGISGYGRLANLLPKLVLAGFTTGVGLKLLDQQIPILLGSDLALGHMLSNFWGMEWLREVEWLSVVCGILVAWITVGLAHLKSFPSALLGIMIAAFISYELDWTIAVVGQVDLEDVALAVPALGDASTWLALAAAAVPLAVLSSAESLISAKAVDEMSGHKSGYSANTELVGQGVGNLASGLVGGMPLAGVIIRSSVNLQSGARTRIAAMCHGLILFVVAMYFGEWLGVIPVAALAGLLAVIAWRLIKIKVLVAAFKQNKLHALAFLAAAVGTLFGYLITGLALGCALVYVADRLGRRKNEKSPILRPSPTIRAVVSEAGAPSGAGAARGTGTGAEANPSLREQAVWSRHVRTRPKIHPTAFVHPTASVIGWVELGREVNVAADTSIRADEGAPFYIGDRSNVQDGVVIHALKDKWVMVGGRRWAVYIGSDVSLAHQALVHGPSMIGSRSFIGFKAIVHDSIIGEGCFIGLGAVVVGVEIPPRKRVPNGWIVDTPEKVRELPDVEHAHAHFNEDVVQVNRGLAVAYARNVAPEPPSPSPELGAQPRSPNLSSLKPL